MSRELKTTPWQYERETKVESLRIGKPVRPWVFASRTGNLLQPGRVEKVFKRILRHAGLPLHFTPHCLRHTFASLLLQQGESPVYVQRQLGHSSIKLTVDTYGRGFRWVIEMPSIGLTIRLTHGSS